jgi:hypothetical protein
MRIEMLKGVTRSTNCKELNLHFAPNEYDYRYKCESITQRDNIIWALQEKFYYCAFENLPVFEVHENSLEDYLTKKKFIKSGVNKMPTPAQRLVQQYVPSTGNTIQMDRFDTSAAKVNEIKC